jgi:hypothetical protein
MEEKHQKPLQERKPVNSSFTLPLESTYFRPMLRPVFLLTKVVSPVSRSHILFGISRMTENDRKKQLSDRVLA